MPAAASTWSLTARPRLDESSQVYLHPDPARLRAAVDRVPSPRPQTGTDDERRVSAGGPSLRGGDFSHVLNAAVSRAGRSGRLVDRRSSPRPDGTRRPGCCRCRRPIRCWADGCAGQGCVDHGTGPAGVCAAGAARSAGSPRRDRSVARPPGGPGRVCRGDRLSAASGCPQVEDCAERILIKRTRSGLAWPSSSPIRRPAFRCVRACTVVACVQQRRHPDGLYCEPINFGGAAPAGKIGTSTSSGGWLTDPAGGGAGGQVSFRGLAPVVIAEVLVGLQQRSRLAASRPRRLTCGDGARHCAARRRSRLADYVMAADPGIRCSVLCDLGACNARRALASPETEIVNDEWDLVVFGHTGTLSFTGITQPWLRAVAKRWAADDLPPPPPGAGRASGQRSPGLRPVVGESAERPDRGEVPAALDRPAMEAFLNRLAYLQSAGQISADAPDPSLPGGPQDPHRDRAMGLTRPGGRRPGWARTSRSGSPMCPTNPNPPSPAETSRSRSCATLCASSTRCAAGDACAIELAIDTVDDPRSCAH